MASQLRVLLAEDNAAFRRGVREMLESTDDLNVVGEAANGEEAVTLAASLRPDVVLIDLRMPDANGVRHEHVGLDAIRDIAKKDPGISVVVLSSTGDERLRLEATQLGACAYLLKDSEQPTVVDTVRNSGNDDGGRRSRES